MGKLTVSMAIFNSYVSLPEGISIMDNYEGVPEMGYPHKFVILRLGFAMK